MYIWSDGQPASQLQLASQPAIWQNVNLTQSQILGEGQVDILLDGQSANQPAIQLQMVSQPDIWPNVNLILSWILGVCIFYINTQVTFCQITNQPASCNWPANQPSDQMSNPDPQSFLGVHLTNPKSDQMSNWTWPEASSGGLYIWLNVNLTQCLTTMSTWPEVWPNVNLTWSLMPFLGGTSYQMSTWPKSAQMSTWPEAWS